MDARPNANETEDDLMRLQESFTASNQPSARVTRKAPPAMAQPSQPLPEAKKQSLFSARIKETKSREYQMLPGSIMSEVKESTASFTPTKDFVVMQTGFPRVYHRNDAAFVKPPSRHSTTTRTTPDVIQHAEPVSVDLKEFDGVHQENVQALSGMSVEEIQEARQEISDKLDPKLIAFIRNRAAKQAPVAIIPPIDTQTPLARPDPHVVEFIKKYVPPSKIEYEKLEWMVKSQKSTEMSIDVSDPTSFVQETLSLLRFDFKGALIDAQVDTSSTSGLHHHSEDQTLAGYTLLELQRLSRSTFPAQRSLALTVLGYVVASVKEERVVASIKGLNVQKLLEYYIDNAGVVLGFRIALDDEFESVVSAGLQGLSSYLDSSDGKEEIVNDKLARLDKRSFALSRRSEMRFKDLTDDFVFNDKPIHKYTIEEIRDTIENDVVLGLYASNIFLRLAYLLTQSDSHAETILALLCRTARHSSFITKYLVDIKIVDIIVEKFLGVTVPFTDASEISSRLACMSIKLIRLLAQPRRDTCVKIAALDISSILAKFIAVPTTQHTLSLRRISNHLNAEIMSLITLFTAYKIDAHVFDDLRQALTSGLADDISCKAWSTFSARVRYLTSVSVEYELAMQCGSQNDALRPFVSLVVDALSNIKFEAGDGEIVEAFKEGWAFVARYVGLLNVESGGMFVLFAERQHFVNEKIVSMLIDSCSVVDKDIAVDASSHYGFWHESRSCLADNLVDASLFSSALSSYLELAYQFSLKSKYAMTKLVTLFQSAPLSHVVQSIISNKKFAATERTNLRVCMIGSMQLSQTWFRIVRQLSTVSEPSISTNQLTLSCAVWLVSALLPGDELLVKSIVDYILDPLILSRITLTSASSHALTHLKEMYYMNTFCEKTLIHSQALQNLRPKQQLMIELGKNVGLPLCSDWMFLPVSVINDELKVNPKSVGARVLITPEGEVETDNGEIVGMMLEVIMCIQGLGMVSLSPEKLYVQLMQIYLLPPLLIGAGCEIFMHAAVELNLDLLVPGAINMMAGQGFSRCVNAIEAAAGGQAKFYQLYRDMVHQYAAVSFGNATFGMLLLVPLYTCFSVDYRKMFWTELIDVLRGFTEANTMEPDDQMTKETDAEMLTIYAHAIKHGKISKDTNPLLYSIALQ